MVYGVKFLRLLESINNLDNNGWVIKIENQTEGSKAISNLLLEYRDGEQTNLDGPKSKKGKFDTYNIQYIIC